MRLYNTLSRQLEELPPPPGPIRMYFCGPTVYQRAHIGNARPFVLGMWVRAWLRQRGYDATLVHNITDVNDKIYDAAPGASAELAARATEWYLQDTGDLGLGMPDQLPKATEAIPSIVRFIEQLVDVRPRVRRGGRRLLPRRERSRLRPPLGPASRSDRGAGAESAEGGSPGLRALEGEQARGGHGLGLALGSRAARLAHRVLGDGRGRVRAGVRDPRRRARPRLPAPRERSRAVARARPRVRARLDAQRNGRRPGRREDVEVAGQRRVAAQRPRHLGARSCADVLPRRALAEADRVRRRGPRPGQGAGRGVPQLLPRRASPATRRARRCSRTSSPPSSTTTSTRPRRSRSSTRGAIARSGRRCAGALGLFGLGSLAEIENAPAEVAELAEQRREARDAKDFAERIACATRSPPRAGRCATSPSLPVIRLVRRS